MGKSKSAKRGFLIAVAIILISTPNFISGCARTEKDSIIEIGEKMFIAQIQDIYLNTKDFLGKTIKLEGIFTGVLWEEINYYYVIRYVPDECCGAESVGFEVKWPQARMEPYPENNSWVEATAVLKLYKKDSFLRPYLELTSLTVLDTRGAEFVSR